MTALLDLVGSRAAGWSATADRLKGRLERARWTAFGLSIGGALLASLASQMSDVNRANAYVALLGAALLAGATFVSGRLLGAVAMQAWVRARAASEALKREAFRFAARAAPYGSAELSEAALDKERVRIEDDVEDLVSELVPPRRSGSSPRVFLSAADYRAQRIKAQVEGYYLPSAERYRRLAVRLKRIEFVLALAATLATVLAVAAGRRLLLGEHLTFDFAALTAVLTTVGAAILAHIEAARYDHLVVTYLATARRLQDQDLHFDAESADPERWSQFVNRCEDIIAAENMSWVAKWTRPRKGPSRP